MVRGRWAPPPMEGNGSRKGQGWCHQPQTAIQPGVIPPPPPPNVPPRLPPTGKFNNIAAGRRLGLFP